MNYTCFDYTTVEKVAAEFTIHKEEQRYMERMEYNVLLTLFSKAVEIADGRPFTFAMDGGLRQIDKESRDFYDSYYSTCRYSAKVYIH